MATQPRSINVASAVGLAGFARQPLLSREAVIDAPEREPVGEMGEHREADVDDEYRSRDGPAADDDEGDRDDGGEDHAPGGGIGTERQVLLDGDEQRRPPDDGEDGEQRDGQQRPPRNPEKAADNGPDRHCAAGLRVKDEQEKSQHQRADDPAGDRTQRPVHGRTTPSRRKSPVIRVGRAFARLGYMDERTKIPVGAFLVIGSIILFLYAFPSLAPIPAVLAVLAALGWLYTLLVSTSSGAV